MRPRRGGAPRAARPLESPAAPDLPGAVARPVDTQGASPAGGVAAELPRPDLRALPARPAAATRVPVPVYLALIAAIAAAGVFGIVTLQAFAAEASFEARALEEEIEQLTLAHDDLRATVAALGMPSRVRDVATQDIGLIEAEQPGFLTVDETAVWPETPRQITIQPR